MFGSIQDTTRRCRRMMLWIGFLALCFIDNAMAAHPKDAKITHDPLGTKKDSGYGSFYLAAANTTLTCAATGVSNMQFKFLRNGAKTDTPIPDGDWDARHQIIIPGDFAIASAGSFTCKAKETGTSDESPESPPLLLTATTATTEIAGVSLTGVTGPFDAGDVALTCAYGSTSAAHHYQFVKTAPGPVKVMQTFEAANTYTLPFKAEAVGKYACMVLYTTDGTMGISADVEIKFHCADNGTCRTDGDPNSECEGTGAAAYCKCTHGGIFSGKKLTCNGPPVTTAAPPNTKTNPADHTTGVSGGGGKDTTGSGGSGTTSGASDLGRPASVLTIVSSLLTLTLNLRG